MSSGAPRPLADLWPGSLEVIQDSPGSTLLPLEAVLNRAILGEATSALAKLEPEIADCVFFDPPYFLQLSGRRLRRWGARTAVEGVNDSWDQFSSFAVYDQFIDSALRGIMRVMKPSATIWSIGTYHNIFRIGKAMQDLGFWLLNDVTWVKTNPMPNWLGVRFTNATETLIWASRSKDARGYTFNREAAKRYGIGQVGAGVWVMPLCTGPERLKGDDGKKAHPTQKPADLLRRVIETSTLPGDLVLDPMAGVGTAGYVARALDRDFLMIERDSRYMDAMRRRFDGPDTCGAERQVDSGKIGAYLKMTGCHDALGNTYPGADTGGSGE